MTKGFVTVVAGDYYCKLARHLYMCYKLFANCNLPFCVITDKQGEQNLSDIFDGVIVKEDFTNTSFDKMFFFTDAPFDENIFVDADCSFVNDANYFFDVFEKNGSDVSGIAGIKELEKGKKGIQFGFATIEKFDIKYDFSNFNGGVYYYKKSDIGMHCVDFMMNDLLPNYHSYELMGRGNKINMGDEPFVIVGMLKYGFKPIPLDSNIMYLVHNAKNVSWNMRKKRMLI